MKRFLYIEAREVSGNHPAGDDALVSFNHCVVTAPDAEGAYFIGSREMGIVNYTDTSGHAKGQFLNDYVIDLDELRKHE